MTTRFMQVMFSNNDEELANQVDNDIKSAKENGVVDTDEVKYEHVGDGNVAITDKENGEVTIAQAATDEADTYDLIAVPDGQLEKFLHPSVDNDGKLVAGDQVGAPDEDVKDHLIEGDPEENEEEGEGEEKEFSVSTDNSAVLRIFSDQVFCEHLFSEVIESEETAKVGALKVEKLADEENAVVVTDTVTGDQAKVELNGEDMDVTELDSKSFSEEEQFDPLYVVGIDPINHVIVDAPEYSEESAGDLAQQLTEDGVDAVQVFETPEEARDYAFELLDGLDVEAEDVEEPQQVEYSDKTIWLTPYADNNTDYMCRLFSEAANGVADLQDEIESAIEDGEEIENDSEIITPVDAKTAVIEDKDNGETTKATLDGEVVKLEAISTKEAEDLTKDLVVESDDDDDEDGEDEEAEEKKFSDCDWYIDETETRMFSENEEFTNYMIRLYSEEADQDEIEKAIEDGEEIENDSEIITPIDAKTAVIEDKESGEFTKAEIKNDDELEVEKISEDEAEELTKDLVVEDNDEDEDEDEEEKKFSDCDWYIDETETRMFSENEEFTDYMIRLYSEEADQDEIEKAIEDGEQIENDSEVITPVDAKTAVIEDKESGEFTKAEIKNDDELEVEKISEDEADELTKDLVVEDNDEDEEKEFSYHEDRVLDKFFADIAMNQAAPAQVNTIQPQVPTAVDGQGNQVPVQVDPQTGEQYALPVGQTVEEAEDKAEAAIQSIQAAAAEAAAQIAEAKAAPAPNAEPDLQEATFSETSETKTTSNDTLVSWLGGIK